MRTVRDISRDDRARIATCGLRTLTDRLKANYSIDMTCVHVLPIYQNSIYWQKIQLQHLLPMFRDIWHWGLVNNVLIWWNQRHQSIMSVDARCVTNVTGRPGRSWSCDTPWRDINLASCLSTSTHRERVSFMLYLALDVEPLFYRFKNV